METLCGEIKINRNKHGLIYEKKISKFFWNNFSEIEKKLRRTLNITTKFSQKQETIRGMTIK